MSDQTDEPTHIGPDETLGAVIRGRITAADLVAEPEQPAWVERQRFVARLLGSEAVRRDDPDALAAIADMQPALEALQRAVALYDARLYVQRATQEQDRASMLLRRIRDAETPEQVTAALADAPWWNQ